MTNLMVLNKKLQKHPKGTVVTPVDDGTVIAVSPVKIFGNEFKASKDNLDPAPAKDISLALKDMAQHRSKLVDQQEKALKLEKGTLLVIPVPKRSCAVYEVVDHIMDHKPRLKIKYRQELCSGFEPAPEDIGAETEIEEAWAMVIYLSNKSLLEEHDIVDDSHELEAVKSKYDGRLIVAMDDHLDEKQLAKLEKYKAGEAVPQDKVENEEMEEYDEDDFVEIDEDEEEEEEEEVEEEEEEEGGE